ncbi:MAG: phosphatase PAP2 family protein [Burkholderiales bacterium]|nr:phosphatase PAP2 family protein [Burkholderiales bacterium]
MGNVQLFELINAPASAGALPLAVATGAARWLIWALPPAIVLAWLRADDAGRREWLQMLLAVLIALGIGQVVGFAWPQPRPAALHLGHQFLRHSADPGLPSDHVTVFWSLALASLSRRRHGVLCFLLLALGGLVGWSRVYLGIHFPYDVAAALPVSAAGGALAMALRRPLAPVWDAVLQGYDRLVRAAGGARPPPPGP